MDKLNKIYFTYEQGSDGNIVIKDIVTCSDSGITKEEFDAEKHFALIGDFFKANNVSSVEEAEEKGIFARFDANTVDAETVIAFVGEDAITAVAEEEQIVAPVIEEEQETNEEENSYALDDDDEYAETEEEKDKSKRIRALIAAGIVTFGVGIGLHSCSEQTVSEHKTENEDDLYKNMTEEQRAFFEPVFKAVEEFNINTTEEGTFKLEQDATTLHMTVDEVVALSIIMNDYSTEELYNIVGTLELDTNNLMNLARSAYSKLSTYYMNAKEASGISQIIRDEDAREFFERHENAVIAFNNNPSTELSDNVIKGLYYDYVHQGATGEYAQINHDGVAWMATSTAFGFELANRNISEFLRINNVSEEEIAKYDEAAAAVGMKLSKITTSDLLKGINEEIDLDVMDEVDNKSLCAAVTTQTNERIDALKLKQQIAVTIVRADAKGRLVEGLQNIGASSLANKVMAADINLTDELLDEIRSYNAGADTLAEEYTTRISSITNKEALVVAVMELAQEKFGMTSEIDVADLINNRFRTREYVKQENNSQKVPTTTPTEPTKQPTTSTTKPTIPVVPKDEYDKAPDKEEFIKENGVVIEEEETTKPTVVVPEKELTEEEKVEVADQKKILAEIENTKNDLIVQGSTDAITYTEEKGAYDYKSKIVNPYNKETINTDNLSLFNIVAHVSAFGENAEKINSNDKQIQARMEQDAKKVESVINSLSKEAKEYLKEQYGSDWKEDFIKESYIYGYTTQIDGSLEVARKMGEELNKSAKEAYEKAQATLTTTPTEKPTVEPTQPETKPTNPTTEPTQPETQPSTTPTEDPNLGEQFEEDEVPYVPNNGPVEYVPSEDTKSTTGTIDVNVIEQAGVDENTHIETPTFATVGPTTEPTQPETQPSTTPTEDENIGEQFKDDEVPYVPNNGPVEYNLNASIVSDAEWDQIFSEEPVQTATTPKIKWTLVKKL